MNKPSTLQALFSDESKWCKNWLAKNELGAPISPVSNHAVSFCLAGGIYHITNSSPIHFSEEKLKENNYLFNKLATVICPNATNQRDKFNKIVEFNNNPKTTFADIRRVIEAAGV